MDIAINLTINSPELAQSINLLAQAMAGKNSPAHVYGQGKDPSTIDGAAQMIPPTAGPLTYAPASVTPVTAQPIAPAPVTQAPAATVPTGGPPTYTIDHLSNAAAELVRSGRMAELQGLLTKYGVQALPHLKPEQYGAFATDLRGLGGKL